jgi:excisionase family DNA binding protein
VKKRRAISGLLLGVSEAAALLGNSERSLRALVARGLVPFRRLGSRVVFRRVELEKFFETLDGVTLADVRANLKARR